jgi:translocation protein SEC63
VQIFLLDRCLTRSPEQKQVLLQTPLLLNALLNVCIARTWLLPTLAVMRLYSSVAQALPPNSSDRLRLTQLPGIDSKDLETLPAKAKMSELLHSLEEKKDPRAGDVKKTLEKWGRVEIVEASFRGKSLLYAILHHTYNDES